MAIKISGTTVIDDNRNISSVGIATVGSGSSTTTINGNTGIVNVGTGVTINGITGNISIAGTISALGFNIPASITSFNPSIGATNIAVTLTSITLNFDQAVGVATTGNIFIRQGSAGGTGIQTIGVGNILSTTNGIIIRLNSTLPFSTSIVPVIPNGFIKTTSGNFIGLNTTGANSYSFITKNIGPGDPFGGGFIMCQASGTRWIVSPYSAEVSRNWFARNDASTRAQQVSGCTGWFVPTVARLQNPGYCCRAFWDSYSSASYWSCECFVTPHHDSSSCGVSFVTGGAFGGYGAHPQRSNVRCVRAFRCVTY